MASEGRRNRFELRKVVLEKGEKSDVIPHTDLLPTTTDGYTIDLLGDVLTIKMGGPARIFPAHQEPVDATSWGFSALAMVMVLAKGQLYFPVIRRSEYLPTFPGLLAWPGGYMDNKGGQPYATAVRELIEETGN
jgi:hypothetical protein